MQLTEFTFRLLVLFLPGLICAFLVDALTSHRPRQIPFFLLRALFFGFSSYLLYWFILHLIAYISIKCFKVPFVPSVHFLKILENTATPVAPKEILFVCLSSVLLGLLITVEATYKVGHKVAQRLRLTRKFGEIDVWGYTFNSSGVEWLTYRDLKEDLMYDGWIAAFSDDGENAEMLLRDVGVYRNSTGQYLYNVGAIYLSRERKSITMEFRGIKASSQPPRSEPNNPEEQKNEQEK